MFYLSNFRETECFLLDFTQTGTNPIHFGSILHPVLKLIKDRFLVGLGNFFQGNIAQLCIS